MVIQDTILERDFNKTIELSFVDRAGKLRTERLGSWNLARRYAEAYHEAGYEIRGFYDVDRGHFRAFDPEV